MDVFTASLCAISAASSLTVRLKRSNRINLKAGEENYYPAKGVAPISNLLFHHVSQIQVCSSRWPKCTLRLTTSFCFSTTS